MLLEIKQLNKKFGGFRAINDLSLSIKTQELRCIIGPNGSGKTTLFNLITGAFLPDSGEIIFKGEALHSHSIEYISSMGISRKFQNPNVFADLSVYDNMLVASRGAVSARRIFERINLSSNTKAIDEMLEIVGLAHARNRFAKELSHGQKQFLEIAMVMVREPQLLLLDEPTAGMTSADTAYVSDLIKKLRTRTTIIVIEHDVDFISTLGATISVLNHGSLVAEGDYSEIASNKLVQEIYFGVAHESA